MLASFGFAYFGAEIAPLPEDALRPFLPLSDSSEREKPNSAAASSAAFNASRRSRFSAFFNAFFTSPSSSFNSLLLIDFRSISNFSLL